MSSVCNSLFKWGQLSFKRSLAKCEIKFSDKGVLEAVDLKQLLAKKIDVLVIEGYLRHQALERMQQKTAGFHTGDLELYPLSTNYGFTCESTYLNDTLKHFYDKSSVLTVAKHREEMFPYTTWIDKLRLELDEAYPQGALLDADRGFKKGPFVSRGYFHDTRSQLETRSLPPHMLDKEVKSQLIALQFLVAPPKGGHLEFYKGALNKQEHEDTYMQKLCILPDSLPTTEAVVKAFAGRCVLFHSDLPFKFSQVETVEIIKDKEKDEKEVNKVPLVALESFIISRGEKKPLAILR
jgi:hypothetical protein